jgi:sulfonate transport system substrate-binding protein
VSGDIDRRGALGALGLLASLAALSACGVSRERDTLRIGSQRGGTKAMMLVSGTLAGIGYPIEWSEFPAAQHLLEALGADAVDLGTVGNAPFLFAYESGSPIKSVQATRFDPRNAANAILVANASPLRSIEDLRGRRVVTGRGSIGHFFLLRALEQARIPLAAVPIVFMPPGDAKAAFASGAVDAWATWNPYVGSAVLHGEARVLADGRSLVHGYGFLVAPDRAIRDKRPIIADFLVRHARAEMWVSRNVDAYARLLAKETGLPFEDARYTADRSFTVIPTDATLIAEQEKVLATFSAARVTRAKRPVAEAFDTSFDRGLVG